MECEKIWEVQAGISTISIMFVQFNLYLDPINHLLMRLLLLIAKISISWNFTINSNWWFWWRVTLVNAGQAGAGFWGRFRRMTYRVLLIKFLLFLLQSNLLFQLFDDHINCLNPLLVRHMFFSLSQVISIMLRSIDIIPIVYGCIIVEIRHIFIFHIATFQLLRHYFCGTFHNWIFGLLLFCKADLLFLDNSGNFVLDNRRNIILDNSSNCFLHFFCSYWLWYKSRIADEILLHSYPLFLS